MLKVNPSLFKRTAKQLKSSFWNEITFHGIILLRELISMNIILWIAVFSGVYIAIFGANHKKKK
ncbi:hypothetical protein [Metabacillus endolithicus]|uniref:hypothetical protein n=1 Tax=Metabacillus endolithicus TaxID=1535204 RepID=UPI00366C898C